MFATAAEADEHREWVRRMGDKYPDLMKRWDEHGQAVEIDEAEALRRERGCA